MAEERQLVGFHIAKEEYGIDILQVQEIIREQEITHIPGAPPYMEGIINIRGEIIPVISIRKRFNLPELDKSEASRIIVVNIDDKTLGVSVDEVSEVLRLADEEVNPPPEMIAGQGKNYIEGIGKLDERLLIILNLAKMFSVEELSQIQSSATKTPIPAPSKESKAEVAKAEKPAKPREQAASKAKPKTAKPKEKARKKTAARKKAAPKKK